MVGRSTATTVGFETGHGDIIPKQIEMCIELHILKKVKKFLDRCIRSHPEES